MNRIRAVAKRGGLIVLSVLLILLGIMSWNCWWFPSRQLNITPITKLALDELVLLERLQAAIRIPTVSITTAKLTRDSDFHRFRDYIADTFPTLHSSPFIRRTGEDLGDGLNPSMLFEWPGQEPELGAILLMSHFDVVPVESNSLSKWSYPPFSGHLDESFVWGRGTLDCKHGVMAILEAINMLSAEGFQPQRTICVALGHDEELGGRDGNRKIAEWMRSRRMRLHVILDEGGCIFTEFPGLNRPAALIGVAEKGYLNIELTVEVDASKVGHASMPPPETAVGILSSAVHHVQSSPIAARTDGGLRETLRYLGPEMPSLFSRLAMSNMWLCESIVKSKLSATPSGNALLRTTMAPTLIEGGVQENVLPEHAAAKLNVRLLPGDSTEKVLAHLRHAIDDSRVEIAPLPHSSEASPVSSTDSKAFGRLHQTICEIYPDAVAAPFILVGSTDTVHYTDLCENIYRFIPVHLFERDTQRFHGIDKRTSRDNYLNIIRFYHQFIKYSSVN